MSEALTIVAAFAIGYLVPMAILRRVIRRLDERHVTAPAVSLALRDKPDMHYFYCPTCGFRVFHMFASGGLDRAYAQARVMWHLYWNGHGKRA